MELDHRNGKKEKQKGYRGSATYLHTPCTRIKERVQECIHQKQKFLYILYIIYIGKIKYILYIQGKSRCILVLV